MPEHMGTQCRGAMREVSPSASTDLEFPRQRNAAKRIVRQHFPALAIIVEQAEIHPHDEISIRGMRRSGRDETVGRFIRFDLTVVNPESDYRIEIVVDCRGYSGRRPNRTTTFQGAYIQGDEQFDKPDIGRTVDLRPLAADRVGNVPDKWHPH